MLTHAHRCGVCGWRGEDDVCPRCGTVLLQGRAFCRRCGKVFDGFIARCDACGGLVEPPPTPLEEEAIKKLLHLPGVDPATARRLHARGFSDPADVLKLALPERAIRSGLHRQIARKITLGELNPVKRVRKTLACPTCGAPREATTRECPACASPWEREPRPEEVRKRLEEVAGEVYDLASDPDFQEMPSELREEILEVFEGAGFAVSTESEYAEQFREWRARGLDTHELERILRDEGSEAFKAKFVRLIRAQILKRRDGARFQCPLCDVELSATVEECGNCGAKFR